MIKPPSCHINSVTQAKPHSLPVISIKTSSKLQLTFPALINRFSGKTPLKDCFALSQPAAKWVTKIFKNQTWVRAVFTQVFNNTLLKEDA